MTSMAVTDFETVSYQEFSYKCQEHESGLRNTDMCVACVSAEHFYSMFISTSNCVSACVPLL